MDVFFLASVVGTIAFAFSGFLAGVQKKLDVMGVFILSMLTANGGGALRDVLVNKTPGVLTDLSGFYMVFGVCVLSYALRLSRYATVENSRMFVLSDALGLVAFSLTGALVGVEAGLSVFGVMVLAFLTASGGGIIRDLMVNEVPAILSSDFYGTVALAVGLAIYWLEYAGIRDERTTLLVFVLALLLRILAYLRNWRLPHVK